MCTTLFSFNSNKNYPIIIASNRDEFYHRPTLNANYWEDYPNIIGGIDKKYLGTWLGISKSGKIGIITNYRDPENYKENLKSRGLLLKKFLVENISNEDFSDFLLKHKKEYNGYNILFGHVNEMLYYSNKQDNVQKLESGIFGLSNGLLDCSWPKVNIGKSKLKNEVKKKNPDKGYIMNILKDEKIALDSELPSTGIALEHERLLSSMFIKSPKYGTRSSIVIMIDNQFEVNFYEDIYNEKNNTFKKNELNFRIKRS